MAAPAPAVDRPAAGAGASPGPAETLFVEMVFPDQANHYGTLFGGNALSLMGKAAFVAATRRARSAVVMASAPRRPISTCRSGSARSSSWRPGWCASAAPR